MHRSLAAIGLVATTAGAVLVLTPLTAPVQPPVVPTLGVVAAIGLLLGGRGTIERVRRPAERTGLPDRTGRRIVDVPGDEFDRTLAAVTTNDDGDRRTSIRDRLEAAAVAVVADAESCDRETAHERIDRGEWTDDDAAAAFFAATDRSPSLRERWRHLARGESPFAQRARRVVDELVERERASER